MESEMLFGRGQALNQFFTRIDFVAGLIDLLAGKQHLGFDPHQCGGHHNEFAGHIYVQTFKVADVVQEVTGDLGYRNVVDIQLVPLYKKEEEVEGPFELWYFYPITHAGQR